MRCCRRFILDAPHRKNLFPDLTIAGRIFIHQLLSDNAILSHENNRFVLLGVNDLASGRTELAQVAASWNGTAPLFVAADSSRGT
jgi:hypothetical protein